MSSVALDLERLVPGGVETDVSLQRISRWRIGGSADVVVRPRNVDELAAVRCWLHESGQRSVVIAGTSNLLFSDSGIRAPVIQLGSSFSSVRVDETSIDAEAGAWVPGVARLSMAHGISGLEHSCGIPGTIGGLVCMNGGSMRRGIGEVITRVQAVASDGSIVSLTKDECSFAYRRSAFQSNGLIVSNVKLQLDASLDRAAIRREMLRILRDRRRKFPQKLPNCGSVFVSDPSMYEQYGPPGKVIERAGFKGTSVGGAYVSPDHANFIINRGDATSEDVLSLIRMIKSAVASETGYSMAVEARYVTNDGLIQEI